MKNKLLRYVIIVFILILSMSIYSTEIQQIVITDNTCQSIETIERIFYWDTNNPPVNQQRYFTLNIQITGGTPGYQYQICKDNADRTNVITGTSSNSSFTISGIYYDKPGLYVLILEIEDSEGYTKTKEIKINNFLPYLPEPIVGVHDFGGHKNQWNNGNFKYVYKFLRGNWNDTKNRKRFERG